MQVIVAFLLRYWLHLVIAGAVMGALWWGHHTIYQQGYNAAKAEYFARELAGYEALVKQQAADRERANKAEADLAAAIEAIPKATPRTRIVVRENPSACVIPAPVADSLRESVQAANRASRGPSGLAE